MTKPKVKYANCLYKMVEIIPKILISPIDLIEPYHNEATDVPTHLLSLFK